MKWLIVLSLFLIACALFWEDTKPALAWITSWTLYGLGGVISKIMDIPEGGISWIVPVYLKLMLASNDVQDWGGGKGPWETLE